ncbi:MAG: lipoprotein signal peptidase [Flavobacteriaceae bacterium]
MSKKYVFIVVVSVLIFDQFTKIYIKTHFVLGQEWVVFDWFKILFVENEGMAWGAKLSDFSSFISDKTAKLALTLFRLIAVVGIGYWLHSTIKKQTSARLIYAIALIFSGALGNIIDSVFYGLVFDDSLGQKATLFAEDNYGSLFYGKVVDMLHFPIVKGYLPDWIPIFGGDYFTFFNPVFNVADIAISTGVGLLLLYNNKAFGSKQKTTQSDKSELV